MAELLIDLLLDYIPPSEERSIFSISNVTITNKKRNLIRVYIRRIQYNYHFLSLFLLIESVEPNRLNEENIYIYYKKNCNSKLSNNLY